MIDKKKIERVNEKLDRIAQTFMGPNAEYGARAGYSEQSEERSRQAAEAEGVTLYQNADGSYAALDESQAEADVSRHDDEPNQT